MTVKDLKDKIDQMSPDDLDKIVRIEFVDSGYVVERDAVGLRDYNDMIVLSS